MDLNNYMLQKRTLHINANLEEYGLSQISDTEQSLSKSGRVFPSGSKKSSGSRTDTDNLSIIELLNIAERYAKSRNCIIDNMAVLALHSRISFMQTDRHHVTEDEVRAIVDEAIAFAEKKSFTHRIGTLFKRRYDKDSHIILTEKDFSHYDTTYAPLEYTNPIMAGQHTEVPQHSDAAIRPNSSDTTKMTNPGIIANAEAEEFVDYAINWDDDALEAKMRAITGIHSRDIMFSDVSGITELDLSNKTDASDEKKIRNILALGNLHNLKTLVLANNKINDISALANIKGLTYLGLKDNQIDDISALAEIKGLIYLGLKNNRINDISALAEMKSLTGLGLSNNQISSISALANLRRLNDLDLSDNQISSIRALANLNRLARLWIKHNQISEIRALADMKSLTDLDLSENLISDIRSLAGLNRLTSLALSNNQISNIEALADLNSLTVLDLSDNQIDDISVLANLKGLTKVWIRHNRISDLGALADLKSLTLYR